MPVDGLCGRQSQDCEPAAQRKSGCFKSEPPPVTKLMTTESEHCSSSYCVCGVNMFWYRNNTDTVHDLSRFIHDNYDDRHTERERLFFICSSG